MSNRVSAAKELVAKARQLDPTSPYAVNLSFRIYLKENDVELALHECKEALRLCTAKDEKLRYALESYRAKLEAIVSQLQTFQAQSGSPDRTISSRVRNKIYSVVGGRTGDLTPSRLTAAGRVFAEEGLLNLAIQHYEQALDLDRQYYPARIRLGHAFRHLGRYDRAYQEFKHVVRALEEEKRWPPWTVKGINSSGLEGLGNVAKSMHNLPSARAYFEQALEIDGNYANGLNGLGMVLCMEGDPKTGADVLRKALAHHATGYWTQNNLGIAMLLLGDVKSAEEHFIRAEQICQTRINAHARITLAHFHIGLAYAGRDMPEQAEKSFREALSLCSATGLVDEILADLKLIEKALNKHWLQSCIRILETSRSPAST
jgi:tetratricopeptide (TPR) repeat protein